MRFGPFQLDLARGTLSRDGSIVDVPPRPFALLCYLAEHAGRVVPSDELLDAVWGHEHLSASSLKATVNNLRRALGIDGRDPRWIVSVPRRGYRFVPDGPPAHVVPAESTAALPPDGLIGREAELHQLQGLMSTQRLVSLVGSAGVGKTRLALAALPHLQRLSPDGAALVRLDALADADALVATIAHALSLAGGAARDAAALAQALRYVRMGLLLDNAEHLAGDLAPLVRQLLETAPSLRVLCTSQRPLQLDAERVMVLEPLALPPLQAEDPDRYAAGRLFLAAVRRRDPRFDLAPGEARALAAVCHALDGVPLELELAAARVPLFGLEGLLHRLRERLAMLRQPVPGAPARQQSLRAALDWSHALLAPLEQQVLRQLSVFEGSFSAAAAEAVLAEGADGTWPVIDALGVLAERNLLAPAGSSSSGVPRWRMLHSIRAFAAEQLAAAGEAPRLLARHADWMRATMRAHAGRRMEMTWHEWVEVLEPEVDNLRAALRWSREADAECALALWAAGVMFWIGSDRLHEALRWYRELREPAHAILSDEAPARLPLRADVAQACTVLCLFGRALPLEEGQVTAERACRDHAALGNAGEQVFDLYLLAMLHVRRQQPLHDTGILARMRAAEPAHWGSVARRYTRWIECQQLRMQGDLVGFEHCLQRELMLARETGNRHQGWLASISLASLKHSRGDAAAGIAELRDLWRDIREAGGRRQHPQALVVLAGMLIEQGGAAASSPEVAEAVGLMRGESNLWMMAPGLAWLPWWRGDVPSAVRLLAWSAAAVAARGETPGPLFTKLRDTLAQQLEAALPEPERAELAAQGERLDEDAAVALAFAGLPVSAPARATA